MLVKVGSGTTTNSQPTGGLAPCSSDSRTYSFSESYEDRNPYRDRIPMKKHKYHFILNEIGLCTGARRVDGRSLLNFMFHTNEVTEEVAEESESLLTKLMRDDKEWIWVEVDSGKDPQVVDKKVIGAMGYSPDDPFDRIIVDLLKVHKLWRKRNNGGIHPLTPIVEVWVANGKKQDEKENKEASHQSTQA